MFSVGPEYTLVAVSYDVFSEVERLTLVRGEKERCSYFILTIKKSLVICTWIINVCSGSWIYTSSSFI